MPRSLLTDAERRLVLARSAEWTGPACWGWKDGYRLDLAAAIAEPEHG